MSQAKMGALKLCRIKVARLSAGMSMRELTAKSGVNVSSICRCEAGKEPTLTNALKLAKALGYSVEDLWELDEAGVSR